MRVKKKLMTSTAAILIAAASFSCSSSTSTADGQGGENAQPTFASIQQEIFNKNCDCHQLSVPSAALDLRTGKSYDNLVKRIVENDAARKRLAYRVAPGNPDSSFLYIKLAGTLHADEGDQMPRSGQRLSQKGIDAVRTWILQGALKN